MDRIAPIERIDAPSVEAFRATYIRESRPVVVCGAMETWPALGRWNLGYLRHAVGSLSVPVLNVPEGVDGGRFKSGFKGSTMLFGEYLERLENTGVKLTHYVAGLSIPDHLPPLFHDISIPAYIPTEKVRQLLWVGRKDTASPLHYDISDNFHALVVGRKRFTLFDPRETRNLYPRTVLSKTPHLSHVDLNKPDHARYPRFRRAASVDVELAEGEMLFLPSCWWHHVKSLEASIAVNFWWKPVHTGAPQYLRIQLAGWLQQTRKVLRPVKAAIEKGFGGS